MPSNLPRLRPLLPWFLTTLYHLAVFGLFAEMFPSVFLALPVPVILYIRYCRTGKNLGLLLCYASVCAALLCEPSTGFAPVVWVAFVPLFTVIQIERRWTALLAMGLWTGWMLATGCFTWIVPAVITFFEWPAAAAWLGFLPACLFIGGSFAILLPLTRFLHERLRLPIALIAPVLMSLLEYWWPSPLPLDNILALVWWPVWLQWLDVAGPHGIGFIIAVVNGLIFAALMAVRIKNKGRMISFLLAAAAIILTLTLHGVWALELHAADPGAPGVNVAIIQPMSPLKILNTDRAGQARAAATLREMSLDAARDARYLGGSPPLIIWPEGAGPFAARTPGFNPDYMNAVRAVQSATSATLIVHNVEFAPRRPDDSRLRYYSAITLIEPVARPTDDYRKVELMPFSEYLPLEGVFPVLRRLLPQSRTVLRGEAPALLSAPGGPAAPLICYEALFPDYIRREVRQGATWIVNLTNDRWYGRRQQPPQHLAFAVLAAVENRRPVVRATNSGISAIIGVDGRIANRSVVMRREVLHGRFHPSAEPMTLYTRFGDVVHPWIFTPLALLLLTGAVVRPRRPQSGS